MGTKPGIIGSLFLENFHTSKSQVVIRHAVLELPLIHLAEEAYYSGPDHVPAHVYRGWSLLWVFVEDPHPRLVLFLLCQ